MKLNIAVTFGGRSVEHEISIISAQQCIKAIDNNKYNVIPLYITKQGVWYTGEQLLSIDNFKDLDKLLSSCQKVFIPQNTDEHKIYKATASIFSHKVLSAIDVVFPVMHGSFGEDGSLQGFFATMNIPYVGCDVLSSAITMDKIITKMLLQAASLPTLDYVWFYADEWIGNKSATITKIFDKLSFPLIIKPGNLGSSIGVSTATNEKQLEDAIDLAVSMSQRIIIEPKLENLREINCAVLGDNEVIEVSVCEEPIRADGILSFSDKYLNQTKTKFATSNVAATSAGMSSAKRKIPAEIPDKLRQHTQELAKKSFIALGCSGVVRIDFLLDQNTEQIYICELNTIPGSLSFYLWEPSGRNFNSLTNRLIELALKKHRKNNNLILSYATNILQNFSGSKTGKLG